MVLTKEVTDINGYGQPIQAATFSGHGSRAGWGLSCSGGFTTSTDAWLSAFHDWRTGMPWTAWIWTDYWDLPCSDGWTAAQTLDASGEHNGSAYIARCEKALQQGLTAVHGAAAPTTTSGTATSVRDDRPSYNLVETCTVTWQLTTEPDADNDGIPDP